MGSSEGHHGSAQRDTDISATNVPAWPLTDAFGTRLNPAELLRGLQQMGLVRARLIARDQEIVLECDDPSPWCDDTARALTWLRTQFSPLVSVRSAPCTPGGAEFIDRRSRQGQSIALAEITGGEDGVSAALEDLLQRLGPSGRRADPGQIAVPAVADPRRQQLARRLATGLDARLAAFGWSPASATLSLLAPARVGLEVVGPGGHGDGEGQGPHFLIWLRPGSERGIRPATLVAASRSLAAVRWLAGALRGLPIAVPGDEVLLDGLAWKASRRPTVAASADAGGMRIRIDPQRCNHCGVCAQMCPEEYLRPDGTPATDDVTACTRCYDCVDACPMDAIRPTAAPDTAMLASALAHRSGWLARLAGLPGPSFPAPFPPSYLLPKNPNDRPKYVLGLAVMTMQEHAAALLRDGQVVGAIEHEKLVRIRHAGWQPPDRPGVTAAVDPTIAIEEIFCRRPIRALLEQEGITLDDVDLIAVNGLHGRYASRISFIDGNVPLPTMRTGRVVYLPHHLCHAASAYRACGLDDAWIFTVDGRGDRECAAIWRGTGGKLQLVDTLLSLTDRSIGGVYEGVTRLLGFGSHGQGSVMALAAFGTPRFDLSEFLSVDPAGVPHNHESGIAERFAHLARQPDEPLTQEHKDLAASLQAALEDTALALLRRHCGQEDIEVLALGGGVALNCRMNERLRRTLRPRVIFAQPGANDAGTALGAALEAWADRGGVATSAMTDASLGPKFGDDAIEKALQRAGLQYRRCESIAHDTARRLADGQVICWFQGGLEFGPRALGARSILADPRRESPTRASMRSSSANRGGRSAHRSWQGTSTTGSTMPSTPGSCSSRCPSMRTAEPRCRPSSTSTGRRGRR
jgi:predicted NodU family carbamoyl transferase/ferredoxin